jgi:hypothetical protein
MFYNINFNFIKNFVFRAGMFICPHHRCGICTKPTASAGGMLFRCEGCLTSYCEDCLPLDRVTSLGRCIPLEQCDYDSKQAYFIHCPSCSLEKEDYEEIEKDINKNKVDDDPNSVGGDEDNDDYNNENDEDDNERLVTQDLKIIWNEVKKKTSPNHHENDEDSKNTKKSKKNNSINTKYISDKEVITASDNNNNNEVLDDVNDSASVDNNDDNDGDKVIVPDPCSLLNAVEVISSHPLIVSILQQGLDNDDKSPINRLVEALEVGMTSLRVRIDRGIR